MSLPEIIRFSTDFELAAAVANEWLRIVPASSQPGPPWLVALSGGRIARRLFEASALLFAKQKLSLEAVHFFWGDERCVPPDDAESNYAIASKGLLIPLNIREANIHRIHGESPPPAAAQAAAADLKQLAPLSATGQPIFDLIFLGMGEDGHVASLFPGETNLESASESIYRPVVASKPPPNRITLGYQVIAAARQVWVLASGSGKSDALRESLRAGGGTPLARVLQSRGETRIFTDISAKQ